MKVKVSLVAAGLLLLVGSSLVMSADLFNRGKYESPAYEVEKSDGKFEIRNYSELVVASAAMEDGTSERNSAFRQLFQYISGKNEKKEKIAMTTPVFTTPSDDKKSVMSFVVPADVVKSGAPKADNQSVKITKRPAGKFAVYRYSGRWTESKEKAAKEKLQEWMKKQGVKAKGAFEKANYDPPFVGVHPLPPTGQSKARDRNQLLVQAGESIGYSSAPRILLGDLNATPWSPHFRKLRRDGELRDSARWQGWSPTWNPGISWLQLPIDHCLVSDEFGVADRRIGPEVGSDHRGVVVDVFLR